MRFDLKINKEDYNGQIEKLSGRYFITKSCLATTAAIMLSQLLACSKNSNKNPPNILLVLTDDHSVPHVGCYGNRDIKTPNLDKLAAMGMRFDRAYVTCPHCVPSRASIMTGQSVVKINMTRFSALLSADIITFPELLKKSGYHTGVASRIYHLDGHNRIYSDVSKEVFFKHNLITFPKRLDYVNVAENNQGYVEQFEEFLEQAPDGKPWFMELSFDDPHRPLDKNAIPEPHDPSKLTLPPFFPDTKLLREDFARYYDEISRFDVEFGRVMDVLKKNDLLKNTLVMFMGDNGGAILRGKGTLYQFGVRVPMIVAWEGVVEPGTATDKFVSGEDLASTFLEIAGLTQPEEMTGVSFLNVLKGEPFDGREYVFAERGAHGYNLPMNTADFDLSRCVVSEQYKFIYNALWQLPFTPVDFMNEDFWLEIEIMNKRGQLDKKFADLYFPKNRPMFELYDLKNDPYEMNNLSGIEEYAEVVQELKAKLTEWMILERDYLPLPIPDTWRAVEEKMY